MRIGSWLCPDGRCIFRVWAPLHDTVELVIHEPDQRRIVMAREGEFFSLELDDITEQTLYSYALPGGIIRPDPASHMQPRGVHGFSQVFDHDSYRWHDGNWRGIPVEKMIIYELHAGVFSGEGTFDAIVNRIGDIRQLGVNAIELMPVAQFSGDRNWGYDGVYPFAVHFSYGGNNGLKRLVDQCHINGIAVILDVVYNHLGPEGNYLADFGPYFTKKYNTPWGYALNYDDAYNEGTRNLFIENAVYWFDRLHVDALRLDAVHAISDMSAYPFVKELSETIADLSKIVGRKLLLIAECDLNDARMLCPFELGGFGIDAQWCDDFHHSLHTLLTKEKQRYYSDFGTPSNLVESYRESYVYSNIYSPYRKRRHGNSAAGRPASQFIICSQNHDQVGNRKLGERLSSLVSFEKLKLAAGATLLSPFIPMIFMGEEYAETAPFLYFVSHTDPQLAEAVRKGRSEEFTFNDDRISSVPIPDPQAVDSFEQSILNWNLRETGDHRVLKDLYTELIAMRNSVPSFSEPTRRGMEVRELECGRVIMLKRTDLRSGSIAVVIYNYNDEDRETVPPLTGGIWHKIIDSSEKIWNGPGSLLPMIIESLDQILIRGSSFAVYGRELGRMFPAERIVKPAGE